jgi:hypothetical protein
VLLLVLAACTPSLNWREVNVASMQVYLPCKPDAGTRPVTLAGYTLELSMRGCQAQDALFAASYLAVPDAQGVPAVLDAWRARTLENMHAQPALGVAPQAQSPENSNHAASPAPDLGTSEAMSTVAPAPTSTPTSTSTPVLNLQTQGSDPQGAPVQAQLVWFVHQQGIYHLAVYAPRVTPEMRDMVVKQVRFQWAL